MSKRIFRRCIFVTLVLLVIYGLPDFNSMNRYFGFKKSRNLLKKKFENMQSVPSIPVVTGACNLEEDKTSKLYQDLNRYLRSLALFNKQPVDVFIVMTQNEHIVSDIMNVWPEEYSRRLKVHIISQWKRHGVGGTECAAINLFLGELLPDLQHVLYTDLDVLFLRPVSYLIDDLKQFNDQQFLGVAGLCNYCPKIVEKPCFNTGYLLVNLTRLREHEQNFTNQIMYSFETLKKADDDRNDQPILNHMRLQLPEIFKQLPDGRNMVSSTCDWLRRSPERMNDFKGWSMIHGSASGFIHYKEFRIIDDVFDTWKFSEHPKYFLQKLETSVKNLVNNVSEKMRCPRSMYADWVLYYPRKTILTNY